MTRTPRFSNYSVIVSPVSSCARSAWVRKTAFVFVIVVKFIDNVLDGVDRLRAVLRLQGPGIVDEAFPLDVHERPLGGQRARTVRGRKVALGTLAQLLLSEAATRKYIALFLHASGASDGHLP